MTDNEQSSINDSNKMAKHPHVLEKSMEPGVINDELLKNFVRSHEANGEVARLCRNFIIDYDTITELCLDFQNLMKIDHIWMCFNLIKLSLKFNKITKIQNLDNLKELRELDLSYNFIDVMENLECLTKLESLTLFQNNIKKIENLNELNQLIRLNLGNNIIETVDGVSDIFDSNRNSILIHSFSFFIYFIGLHLFAFHFPFSRNVSINELIFFLFIWVFLCFISFHFASFDDS